MSRIAIYEQIAQKTHIVSEDEAKRIVTAELSNYMSRLKLYLSDPKNANAQITIETGANIFLEVMQSGLSLSSIANHIYLSRMKGTGVNIGYKVTADGEIYLAQKSGAIDHCSEPVLVWRGEQFSISNTPDGKQVAQHTMFFEGRPKFTLEGMLAGYIYVVYPDGSRELSWLSSERLKELRAKSQNPAMYDDESFVQTKLIKHALRKVRKTPFAFSIGADNTEEALPESIAQPSGNYAPAYIVSPPTHQQAQPQSQPYAQQPYPNNSQSNEPF
ncbi:MAG: hypothetical protein BGO31_00045 [Bacteroidetes bacterium 43-16]|nr:MAG: hypothetical protein BGO31_00045 [Bacteroidetes bacterium 43-16]